MYVEKLVLTLKFKYHIIVLSYNICKCTHVQGNFVCHKQYYDNFLTLGAPIILYFNTRFKPTEQ